MTASRIKAAFEATDDVLTHGERKGYQAPGFLGFVADHVRAYSTDRRYRLHLNAASTPCASAIVTYRGVRYYAARELDGRWTVQVSR